jgi:hypothetical protein
MSKELNDFFVTGPMMEAKEHACPPMEDDQPW